MDAAIGDAGTRKRPTESLAKNKGKGQARRRSCGTFDEDTPGSSKALAKKRCVADLSQMHAKSHDGKLLRKCRCIRSNTALRCNRGCFN